VADSLGIRPVGWIFTDLLAEDLSKGSVKHFRGNIVRRIFMYLVFAFVKVCEEINVNDTPTCMI
jgi:hypothetical protein